MLVNRAGIHKMLFRIASREDPDQIFVCTVFLGLFGRQQVFKILEHCCNQLYEKNILILFLSIYSKQKQVNMTRKCHISNFKFLEKFLPDLKF